MRAAMQAGEFFKNELLFARGDSATCIDDLDLDPGTSAWRNAIAGSGPQQDGSGVCVLDRVTDQICDHLTKTRGVCLDGPQVVAYINIETQILRGCGRAILCSHATHEFTEIRRDEPHGHLPSLCANEVMQIVDERQGGMDGSADPFNAFQLVIGKIAIDAGREQSRKAIRGTEGVFDVMAETAHESRPTFDETFELYARRTFDIEQPGLLVSQGCDVLECPCPVEIITSQPG
jgi:hypothetical protein